MLYWLLFYECSFCYSIVLVGKLIFEFVRSRCHSNGTASIRTLFHFIFIFGEIFTSDSSQFFIGLFTPGTSSTFVCVICQIPCFKRKFGSVDSGEVSTLTFFNFINTSGYRQFFQLFAVFFWSCIFFYFFTGNFNGVFRLSFVRAWFFFTFREA